MPQTAASRVAPVPAPGSLKPRAVVLLLVAAVALAILNFAAFATGSAQPWLAGFDLAIDLLVLGAGIMFFARQATRGRVQAELDATQARLAAIVDSAMDAMITVDETQRIVVFNHAAEEVFGCKRIEVLGGPLERFLPVRFRATHAAHIKRFARTGVTSRRMGATPTLWGLRANGDEFPIEASISQATEGGKRFLTVILRDVTLRKAHEDALQRQQAELRELSARVLEARDDEKTRIARELHDELGQMLTALKMDLASLREGLAERDPALGARAGELDTLIDSTVAAVRRIAADLRPLMLDDLGLTAAAEWLVEDFSERSGIKCRLEFGGEATLDGLGKDTANTIYRALQESLTNIARHSGARNAWVMLAADEEHVRLEVEDDGRGIEPGEFANTRSLGLKGMRERVAYLGGAVEIGRAPRGGTRVRLRLPVTLHPLGGAA
jgi:PAS domain S-box-containing protein